MREHRQADPLSGDGPPKDIEILDTFERIDGLTRSLIYKAKQSFADRNAALAHDLAYKDPRSIG